VDRRPACSLVLVADVGHGWAAASTDRSRLARMIVWQGSDVLDYRLLPARPVRARPPPSRFRRAPGDEGVLAATVGVQAGGRVVPRNLERFLVATGTTAPAVLSGR
jgi:hypothetical protein